MDLWGFEVALPAFVHMGTNDGTVPVCAAAKQEYGIGKVGDSRLVCASDDTPNPKSLLGYTGFAWCPDCKWALTHMKTPEFMEWLHRRGSTVRLIVINLGRV